MKRHRVAILVAIGAAVVALTLGVAITQSANADAVAADKTSQPATSNSNGEGTISDLEAGDISSAPDGAQAGAFEVGTDGSSDAGGVSMADDVYEGTLEPIDVQ